MESSSSSWFGAELYLLEMLPFLSAGLCPSCVGSLRARVVSLLPPPPRAEEPAPVERVVPTGWDSDPAAPRHLPFEPSGWGSDPLPPWADMAQEDDLAAAAAAEEDAAVAVADEEGEEEEEEAGASQRELHRFRNVLRKDDFICLERVKGQLVNILAGLELHAGVFSTAEQKLIVDCVYRLQEMGKRGELGDHTYTEPEKWMRGRGRVTIQFGCCYNYATDRKGNPPGIIRSFVSDPIPELFKVMIKRLVRWRILPTDCVPDSCIVNMYDPGDCIPPHIDSHDFVRPFCTVSFLSECNMLFGSDLKIAGPGEFTGSFAIPLPAGSVLVINGNGADVAKHCVPAVPSKRISITFRKMDPAKRPFSFKDDPGLLNITPLKAAAAPETSRSSDEGKGKQLHVQTRDPGRSRKSKGRTTPAGKTGWGGILGDQPPQHPQNPISSVSSDRERDSIGRSREPRYPPSSDRERDSIERPREPRYPRDAPSHGKDLRDRPNRLPHERTPGCGVFFVNDGKESPARGERMEDRQLQMINRIISSSQRPAEQAATPGTGVFFVNNGAEYQAGGSGWSTGSYR